MTATWDSPPRPNESGFPAFKAAFRKFIVARDIKDPKRTTNDDKREKNEYKREHALREGEQPQLGQDPSLKLMPFQVGSLMVSYARHVDSSLHSYLD